MASIGGKVTRVKYSLPRLSAGLKHNGHPLAANLESCWLFDEGSGTTAHDLCGRHNITLNLATLAWTRTGLFNNGIISAATGSTTDAATVSGFPQLAQSFSIEVWYKIDAAGSDNYGSLFTQSSTSGLFLRNSGAGYHLIVYTGSDRDSTNTINVNTHQQGLVTYNNNKDLVFYGNGKFVNYINIGSYNFTPSTLFNDFASETFRGTVSLMRIWHNRALNSVDVGNLYRTPLSMFEVPADAFTLNPRTGGGALISTKRHRLVVA